MAPLINTLPPKPAAQLQAFFADHLGVVFPAAQLAVFYQGECVLNTSWETSEETLFDLASLTKLFTTSAFLALASEERVALDDPVVNIIPEFGEINSIGYAQNPHTEELFVLAEDALDEKVNVTQVTFRHLLTHTSGLAPWRNIFRVAGPIPPPPDESDPTSPQERWRNALQAICAYPFADRIGGQIHYSDLGLMLLGEAVSRLSSDSLENVIHSRITAPLGLKSIQANPMQHGVNRMNIAPTEDDRRWRKRRCWGEVHDENACSVGGIAGHAGLWGTAYDLARFGKAWLQESSMLSVDPQWMQAAKREQVSSGGMRRGLGWMLKARQNAPCGDLFGDNSYGHNGYTGTSLWIDPDASLVVACLTNRVYFGRDEQGILNFRPLLHDLIYELTVV
jgi:CubicO group peptidase (beta-lactamase class C family)